MEQNNTGPWIETFTGKKFYYLHPSGEAIDIRDIAHALSLTCRFAGHSEKFYSIAQHSVLVSYICSEDLAIYGLMHDAAEAYLMDMPTPLKDLFPEYKIIEQNIMTTIATKFNLNINLFEGVKQADKKLLSTEARDLMEVSNPCVAWGLEEKPLIDRILPWCWESSETRFLRRFRQLYKGVSNA